MPAMSGIVRSVLIQVPHSQLLIEFRKILDGLSSNENDVKSENCKCEIFTVVESQAQRPVRSISARIITWDLHKTTGLALTTRQNRYRNLDSDCAVAGMNLVSELMDAFGCRM